MLKNLLLYRFVLFNSSAVALMAWLASKGYITLLIASDPTGISLAIAAMFLLSGISTVRQAWKITKEKNAHKEGHHLPKNKAKRMIKLNRLAQASENMALLGLIGTVVGFIIAFATSDPTTLLSAADVGTGVATMMKGMGIALYTTLTGAVLGGWTSMNYSMLKEQVDVLEVDENDYT